MNPTDRSGPDGMPRLAPGFTLLEVLIAVSILSVIAVILHGGFSTVLNSVERVRSENEQLRLADFLVTHFEKNVSGAYVSSRNAPGQGAVFVGKDQVMNGTDADTLMFCTSAARLAGGALPGDTKQVTYALEEVDDLFTVFTVREQPRLMLPRTDDKQGAQIAAPVWSVPMASLDFKYFDGVEFHDSWNSAEMAGRGLPCAVRIEAHFVPKELEWAADEIGLEKTVLTMVVSIPLGLPADVEGALWGGVSMR